MITLRTEVTDQLTFRELVTRTASSVMDSFTNSELPFEQVVEAVRPVRDPLRHPLFQIEFTSLGRWGTHRAQAADLEFTMDQLHDGAAKFDMSFLVGENDGLELSLEYNTSLYRHGTASALLGAFRQVLEQVAENPDLQVGDISLVEEPAASRHARELSRGGPVDEAAWTTTLDRAFRERATIHPDAVAVRHGSARLDYAALDRWSEAIAHRLRDRGVRHGDPVAVCVSRGPAAVAAVLGVLKAGAHYVPVDQSAPAERTRTVLADAKARHALVDEAAQLPVPLELVTTGTAAPVREVPSLAPTATPATWPTCSTPRAAAAPPRGS